MRSLALITLFGILATTASAQAPAARKVHFGAMGGFITPGAFYWIGGPYESYELAISPSVSGFVDLQVAENVSVGAFLDLHMMNAFDESATMFDIGASLKAKLAGKAGGRSWGAVVEVGHGAMSGIYYFSGTNYLTIKGGAQLMVPAGNRHWVAEALIWGGPMGGNADVSTTFGPVGLLRFGVRF